MRKLLIAAITLLSIYLTGCSSGESVSRDTDANKISTQCYLTLSGINFKEGLTGELSAADDVAPNDAGMQFTLMGSNTGSIQPAGLVYFGIMDKIVEANISQLENGDNAVREYYTTYVQLPENTDKFFVSIFADGCISSLMNFTVATNIDAQVDGQVSDAQPPTEQQ